MTSLPDSKTYLCGCVTIVQSSPGRVKIRRHESCRHHMICNVAFPMLHADFPGHEECCDLPALRAKMQKHTLTSADLRAALDFVVGENYALRSGDHAELGFRWLEREAAYAAELIDRLEEEGL